MVSKVPSGQLIYAQAAPKLIVALIINFRAIWVQASASPIPLVIKLETLRFKKRLSALIDAYLDVPKAPTRQVTKTCTKGCRRL